MFKEFIKDWKFIKKKNTNSNILSSCSYISGVRENLQPCPGPAVVDAHPREGVQVKELMTCNKTRAETAQTMAYSEV